MIKRNVFFFVVLGLLFLQLSGVILLDFNFFDSSPLFVTPEIRQASVYYVLFIFLYIAAYATFMCFTKAGALLPRHLGEAELYLIQRSIFPNVVVLLFCCVAVFVFWGGREILLGEVARGELRRMELGGGLLRP